MSRTSARGVSTPAIFVTPMVISGKCCGIRSSAGRSPAWRSDEHRQNRRPPMNPRRFAVLGGSVLVTLGLAGISGMLAAVSRAAFFRPPYWINWFHLSLGSLLLGPGVRGSRNVQAGATLVGTIMGLATGLLGLL